MDAPIIELAGVVKSFGPVEVLKGVDLKVYPGKVTALVGDNGAGKSTLIKGLAGVQPYDAGEVASTASRSPCTRRATRPGSASRSSTRTSRSATTSTSCRTCSSAAKRRSSARFDEGQHGARGLRHPASLSVRTVKSVRQKVSSLSGGQRQTVAIARAVLKKARRRHPRRADRRARRRADRAGAEPRAAPRRPGRRGHHHQPQPRRRVRGRRLHQRALPRPDGRLARRAARPTTTTSSATSPAPRPAAGSNA